MKTEKITMENSIGKNIKEARKNVGITQVVLANMTGIKQSVISSYESGRIKPHSKSLIKLANALRCSITKLDENFNNILPSDNDMDKNTLEVVSERCLDFTYSKLDKHMRKTLDAIMSSDKIRDDEKSVIYNIIKENMKKESKIDDMEDSNFTDYLSTFFDNYIPEECNDSISSNSNPEE